MPRDRADRNRGRRPPRWDRRAPRLHAGVPLPHRWCPGRSDACQSATGDAALLAVFLTAAFFVAVVLAAVFFAVAFFAAAFFVAVFLVAAFFVAVFFTAVFLAVASLATAVFFTAAFLVAVFFAAVFFAARPPRGFFTGAAASNSAHSVSVSVLGSRSFGIRAFFSPSVMYGP